jgi:hypothetical protein
MIHHLKFEKTSSTQAININLKKLKPNIGYQFNWQLVFTIIAIGYA